MVRSNLYNTLSSIINNVTDIILLAFEKNIGLFKDKVVLSAV